MSQAGEQSGGGSGVRPGYTPSRFGAVYGVAILVGHAGQFAWLIVGSRVLPLAAFGTVLAAQALYAALQFIVDSGAGFYGARLAATAQLGSGARGSLIRLRLQMALAFGGVVLIVGAAGGRQSLEAAAPFGVALVLFALFNYWEPLGRGDSRPVSAYLVARSLGPAVAVAAFGVAGAEFPLYVVGAVECAVLIAVAATFRLGMRHGIGLALEASRAPWRAVLSVGLPGLLLQLTLAAGPVVLVAAGRAASAAILAVAIRIVTGMNQLALLTATSLFPAVARDAASPPRPAGDAHIRLGLTLVVGATALVTAAVLAAPSLVTRLLLDHGGREAEATTMLTVATATAVGYLTFVVLVLVASGHERAALAPLAAGSAVTAAGAAAVVAFAPAHAALWMGAGLASGVLAAAAALAVATRRALPLAGHATAHGAAAAIAIVAAAAVATTAPMARMPAAAVLAIGAAATLAASSSVRRLVGRARRATAAPRGA